MGKIVIGFAGGMVTAGDRGKRLHALQPRVGGGWQSLCQVNRLESDARPIPVTGADVTCKTCRRVLAALARRSLRYG